MKRKNKNNGITLIALIITIIVMLILVGVSISMVVNGGLFGFAGKAAKETEEAKKTEETLGTGKIKIDGITYNSIDEYLNEKLVIEYRKRGTTILLAVKLSSEKTWSDVYSEILSNSIYPEYDKEELEEIFGVTEEARSNIMSYADMIGIPYESALRETIASESERIRIQEKVNDIATAYITLPTGEEKEYRIGIDEKISYPTIEKTKYTFYAKTNNGRKAEITVNLGEEEFSEIYSENTPITQKINGKEYTAWIPKGFAVGISEGINKIENGLVIQDEKGNQFVWVPIFSDVEEIYEYEKEIYREPALLDDDTSHGITLETLSEEYENMVNSVNFYRGFYIGRYETTVGDDGKVGSKYGQKVWAYTSYTSTSSWWYESYEKQKNETDIEENGTSVQTAMVYGQLWDRTLEFITMYDSWYNCFKSPSGIEGVYGNTTVYAGIKNAVDTTQNIWGLGSSFAEWSQEILVTTGVRIARSGTHNNSNGFDVVRGAGARLFPVKGEGGFYFYKNTSSYDLQVYIASRLIMYLIKD